MDHRATRLATIPILNLRASSATRRVTTWRVRPDMSAVGVHAVTLGGMIWVIAARNHSLGIGCALAFVGVSMALAPAVRRSPAIGDHILDLWLMALIMLAMAPAAGVSSQSGSTRTAVDGHVHGSSGAWSAWIVIAVLGWLVARPLWVRLTGRSFACAWWFSAITCAVGVTAMLAL